MKRFLLVSVLLALSFFLVLTSAAAQETEETYFSRTLKKAESGDASAQFGLGTIYDFGNGVARDPKKAFEWYEKAAKQGHAFAQHSLGKMYEDGEAVEQDYKKAVEWNEKAAMQDFGPAQSAMGKFHYFGRGCEKSLVRSYAYATIQDSTDEDSLQSLNSLFSGKLNDAELLEAKDLAGKFRQEIEKKKQEIENNKKK